MKLKNIFLSLYSKIIQLGYCYNKNALMNNHIAEGLALILVAIF